MYFCEFTAERRKREIEEMEKELGDDKNILKENINTNISEAEMTNKKVNDLIYRQINGMNDSAFVSMLIIPIALLLITSIIIITTIILNFIG